MSDFIETLARAWDAEPDDRQPWCPPGAWVPKVGDRVRIRLSAECQHESQILHAITREPISEQRSGHRAEFEGVTGRVMSIGDPSLSTPHDGHVYAVAFDVPILPTGMFGGQWVGTTMSLGELLPLDQPATDDEGTR